MSVNLHTAVIMVPMLAIQAGCATEPNATNAAGETGSRDSAGVTIVTSGSPAWKEGAGWRIDATATLDIGAEAGAPEYLLADAHSPVQLGDGRIAVANMQTNEIRFYSQDGKFITKTGSTGQGPGEFEQLYKLKKISGDSLMGLEPATLTSIFSPEGKYIRRFDLAPVPGRGNIWWLGRLSSGTLLAISLQREGTRTIQPDPNAKPGTETGGFDIPKRDPLYRDSLLHFLYDMNGRMLDSIGKMPGQWLGEARIFPPNAAYAFRENSFYHSPGDAIEIRVFRSLIEDPAAPRPSGPLVKLEKIIRPTPNAGPPVDDAAKKAYVGSQRAIYERIRKSGRNVDLAAMERRWAQTEYPPNLPAHANRMYIDPDGNIWLQSYQMNPQTDTASFIVFDASGTWLGNVGMPANFTVGEIGSDYVLGIWHDDMDVQHVRKYPLVKKGS